MIESFYARIELMYTIPISSLSKSLGNSAFRDDRDNYHNRSRMMTQCIRIEKKRNIFAFIQSYIIRAFLISSIFNKDRILDSSYV